MYDKSELNNDELENMIDKWCTRWFKKLQR
jgi:hypothetical protein